ncbi:hypothetical protein B484DRAFT_398039 [Ochromonadaceae sp. CCMP2298]|nr:hypothetical protein B484DRAFT_398039 [Ochromonadaceae sp. CCMP2298]
MRATLALLLCALLSAVRGFVLPSRAFRSRSSLFSVEVAPYEDIIPFLSEHIQVSDQLLFLGTATDLSLQLAKNGYGTGRTGFMLVVDNDAERVAACEQRAQEDADLALLMKSGNLKFQVVDLSNMPEVCKQSVFDSIVDYRGLDSIMTSEGTGREQALRCIDHLQDAVRLGNILVCLSNLDKETFCAPFDERFGWVQELDGDPGEISAWYRGKTNIAATKSNFQNLGLKMYVYTNTDNC